MSDEEFKENTKTSYPYRDTNNYQSIQNSEFLSFWKEFKNAVNAGDKNAVLQMTNIPFKDFLQDVYDKSKSLTSDNEETFLKDYGRIFLPGIVNAINTDSYRGWNKDYDSEDIGPDHDVIGEEDFLLMVPYETVGRDMDLAFTKINGIYKLSYIPYYE